MSLDLSHEHVRAAVGANLLPVASRRAGFRGTLLHHHYPGYPPRPRLHVAVSDAELDWCPK